MATIEIPIPAENNIAASRGLSWADTSVPDRWLKYSRFHQCIGETRILPTKTPLKKTFNTDLPLTELVRRNALGVPQGDEFTPTDLMDTLRQRGQQLGLVIDLTNTKRYYKSEEFTSANVKYEKIKCEGHEIPSDHVYMSFSKTLKEFFSENPKDIAVVHCTHGINRTGYLVCRYIIEHCGYKVEDAIKAFEDARGYKMERDNYLEHLRKGCPRYNYSTHTDSGGNHTSSNRLYGHGVPYGTSHHQKAMPIHPLIRGPIFKYPEHQHFNSAYAHPTMNNHSFSRTYRDENNRLPSRTYGGGHDNRVSRGRRSPNSHDSYRGNYLSRDYRSRSPSNDTNYHHHSSYHHGNSCHHENLCNHGKFQHQRKRHHGDRDYPYHQ